MRKGLNANIEDAFIRRLAAMWLNGIVVQYQGQIRLGDCCFAREGQAESEIQSHHHAGRVDFQEFAQQFKKTSGKP